MQKCCQHFETNSETITPSQISFLCVFEARRLRKPQGSRTKEPGLWTQTSQNFKKVSFCAKFWVSSVQKLSLWCHIRKKGFMDESCKVLSNLKSVRDFHFTYLWINFQSHMIRFHKPLTSGIQDSRLWSEYLENNPSRLEYVLGKMITKFLCLENLSLTVNE